MFEFFVGKEPVYAKTLSPINLLIGIGYFVFFSPIILMIVGGLSLVGLLVLVYILDAITVGLTIEVIEFFGGVWNFYLALTTINGISMFVYLFCKARYAKA